MLTERTCPLAECGIKFQTDNPRKEFCSPEHSKIGRVRRWRALQRKKAGSGKGGGGGNGGGGGTPEPTLFDSITPVSPLVFDTTCYRPPDRESDRKPLRTVRASGAAA